MKTMGDWMKDLGFRDDADNDTKKAFFMQLARAAFPNDPRGAELVSLSDRSERASHRFIQEEPANSSGEQLSFDFEGCASSAAGERKSG